MKRRQTRSMTNWSRQNTESSSTPIGSQRTVSQNKRTRDQVVKYKAAEDVSHNRITQCRASLRLSSAQQASTSSERGIGQTTQCPENPHETQSTHNEHQSNWETHGSGWNKKLTSLSTHPCPLIPKIEQKLLWSYRKDTIAAKYSALDACAILHHHHLHEYKMLDYRLHTTQKRNASGEDAQGHGQSLTGVVTHIMEKWAFQLLRHNPDIQVTGTDKIARIDFTDTSCEVCCDSGTFEDQEEAQPITEHYWGKFGKMARKSALHLLPTWHFLYQHELCCLHCCVFVCMQTLMQLHPSKPQKQ